MVGTVIQLSFLLNVIQNVVMEFKWKIWNFVMTGTLLMGMDVKLFVKVLSKVGIVLNDLKTARTIVLKSVGTVSL